VKAPIIENIEEEMLAAVAAAAAAASSAAAAAASPAPACLPPLNSASVIIDDESNLPPYLAQLAGAARVSQERACAVLEDVDSEFSSLASVWKHFLEWRTTYPKQYLIIYIITSFVYEIT
jgi:hypothetical protein